MPVIKSSQRSVVKGPHMMLGNTGGDAQEHENLWRHVGVSACCGWLMAQKVCLALGKSNWAPAQQVQTPESGFRSQRGSHLKREVRCCLITQHNALVRSRSHPSETEDQQSLTSHFSQLVHSRIITSGLIAWYCHR